MSERGLKSILIISGALFLFLFCLLPVAFMIATSLSKDPDFLSPLKSFSLSFEHYRAVIQHPTIRFKEYLRNSLIVSSASAFFCVWISAFAAYAVTRLHFKGKVLFLLTILALSMFPQISLMGYLFKLMTHLGWINTYQVLIPPYIAWILPLSLWILTSYFSQIPKELDEAALMDGCSRWQILIKIIFPIALPGIFSVGLLSFIFAFNEFMFALMLTTDHHARTIPVGIALFEGLHGQIPWGQIMAASTLSVMPLIFLTFLFQRKIVQGLTQGAVKQ